MRVHGLMAGEFSDVVVKSTASYTRLPQHPSNAYQNVNASLADTPAPHLDATHRVNAGENLTRIVREFLVGQGKTPSNSEVYDGVRNVAEANGLRNVDLIHPGQALNLSVLQERSAALATSPATSGPVPTVAELVPRSAAPLIEETPLPPVTPMAHVVPSDSLRASGLTRSEAPTTIAFPEKAVAPPSVAADVAARYAAKVAPTASTDSADTFFAASTAEGVGGLTKGRIGTLQRLLNGTTDTLSLVRELMGEKHAPETVPTATSPWEPILKGEARLSSNYGTRKDPFTGRMGFHGGIDLAAKRGTEITALRDGEVVFSGWKGGYGNTVVVRHDNGLESLYGHTAKNLVSVGDTVRAGTVLANVGSTGRSTGPHLHLELRRHGKSINPIPHLEASPVQLAKRSASSK